MHGPSGGYERHDGQAVVQAGVGRDRVDHLNVDIPGTLRELVIAHRVVFADVKHRPGNGPGGFRGIDGDANAPGGIMLPEFYNQLGAMHGTIMVFLAVVPMLVGAFGNYVLPLQIGDVGALARTALAPRQLPVGALTAAIGVPLFLILMSRSRSAAGTA